jgi:hypothetical protein
MNTELIKSIVGNKIFSATFLKKNNEVREINCRLGVTKYLKDGKKKYDAEYYNYITVYDLQKKGYRTINLNKLIELRANKEVIKVNENQYLKFFKVKQK